MWPQRLSRLAVASLAAVLAFAALAQSPEPSPPPPSWLASAQVFIPSGFVAGDPLRTDEAALTGLLPIFAADSDDPAHPASAFATGEVLEVTLARRGERLEAVAASRRPRTAADLARAHDGTSQDLADQFAQMDRELAAKSTALPPGTEACHLGAWSVDRDPKGLNVRAAPSSTAKVLGTLPPPFRYRNKGRENTPEGGWLTEFTVIGYRAGWFLIENAKIPGKDYEDDATFPKNAPKPFAGRGWVHGSRIGAQFANGGTRVGGLFKAPHPDAPWRAVMTKDGNAISADGGPDKILACSGMWALVEVAGQRGWWRALCSNQVTNCS